MAERRSRAEKVEGGAARGAVEVGRGAAHAPQAHGGEPRHEGLGPLPPPEGVLGEPRPHAAGEGGAGGVGRRGRLDEDGLLERPRLPHVGSGVQRKRDLILEMEYVGHGLAEFCGGGVSEECTAGQN
jgi:hypothetical protein